MKIKTNFTKATVGVVVVALIAIAVGITFVINSDNQQTDSREQGENPQLKLTQEDTSKREAEGQASAAATAPSTKKESPVRIACEILNDDELKSVFGGAVSNQRLEIPPNLDGVSVSNCTFTDQAQNKSELKIYRYRDEQAAKAALVQLQSQAGQAASKGIYNVQAQGQQGQLEKLLKAVVDAL